MELLDAACGGEGAERIGEKAHDLRGGVLGLELHGDGVEDGNEFALVVEVEPHNGLLDGADHAKSLRVPPGNLVQIVVLIAHGPGV